MYSATRRATLWWRAVATSGAPATWLSAVVAECVGAEPVNSTPTSASAGTATASRRPRRASGRGGGTASGVGGMEGLDYQFDGPDRCARPGAGRNIHGASLLTGWPGIKRR
jgi:hypothetical protein